jgi:hypothetical protein
MQTDSRQPIVLTTLESLMTSSLNRQEAKNEGVISSVWTAENDAALTQRTNERMLEAERKMIRQNPSHPIHLYHSLLAGSSTD